MFNATRFKTLMLREWLQNRWTWIIVMAALPVLVLGTLPFGEVRMDEAPPAVATTLLALGAPAVAPLAMVLMAWTTVLFMATGLARRDQQDRSVEFWMSLPGHHHEHVGAQYLMHALVFPLAALVLGLLAGLLLSPLVVLKFGGLSALGDVSYTSLLPQLLAPTLAALLSVLLAPLWMASSVLLLMALSAWVKRLALPILVVLGTFLANWPGTAPSFRAAMQTYGAYVGTLVDGPVRVFTAALGGVVPADTIGGDEKLRAMGLAEYAQRAIGDLASLPFLISTAIALLSAAALIARRRRG